MDSSPYRIILPKIKQGKEPESPFPCLFYSIEEDYGVP